MKFKYSVCKKGLVITTTAIVAIALSKIEIYTLASKFPATEQLEKCMAISQQEDKISPLLEKEEEEINTSKKKQDIQEIEKQKIEKNSSSSVEEESAAENEVCMSSCVYVTMANDHDNAHKLVKEFKEKLEEKSVSTEEVTEKPQSAQKPAINMAESAGLQDQVLYSLEESTNIPSLLVEKVDLEGGSAVENIHAANQAVDAAKKEYQEVLAKLLVTKSASDSSYNIYVEKDNEVESICSSRKETIEAFREKSKELKKIRKKIFDYYNSNHTDTPTALASGSSDKIKEIKRIESELEKIGIKKTEACNKYNALISAIQETKMTMNDLQKLPIYILENHIKSQEIYYDLVDLDLESYINVKDREKLIYLEIKKEGLDLQNTEPNEVGYNPIGVQHDKYTKCIEEIICVLKDLQIVQKNYLSALFERKELFKIYSADNSVHKKQEKCASTAKHALIDVKKRLNRITKESQIEM
ncbi:hypothetical protein NEAUS03_0352 [Nematocida ausubeli]|nr:hypothetical protein NEAUS03_0352 [Nematocida ausubeli]